ncbi:MAG: transketolase C-terminal domain-containing protein [Caldilineaceae bacterium]
MSTFPAFALSSSNAYDAKGLFATALRSDDPVIFLEHKSIIFIKTHVPAEEYTIPFGQARIARGEQRRHRRQSFTVMVDKTLAVCEKLAQEGLSIEVIDPRTVAPLDLDTILASSTRPAGCWIVDENFGPCGVGAEIAALVGEQALMDLDVSSSGLNGAHTHVPYSPTLKGRLCPPLTASSRQYVIY